MRLTILILLAILISSSFLLALVPPPATTQHTKPTKFCEPTHAAELMGSIQCGNGKGTCLKGAKTDEVCKDGERMEETQLCSSFCFKEMCHCCAVLRPAPKKGK